MIIYAQKLSMNIIIYEYFLILYNINIYNWLVKCVAIHTFFANSMNGSHWQNDHFQPLPWRTTK